MKCEIDNIGTYTRQTFFFAMWNPDKDDSYV